MDLIEHLRNQLREVLETLERSPSAGPGTSDPVQVERPRKATHGDLYTNLPMVLAKDAGQPPLTLAEQIKARLQFDPEEIAAVQAAPPGFINFTLADTFLRRQLPSILAQSEDYGKSETGAGKRALVEFVSANPTGPLTVGHGRNAILGDVAANILSWNGYQVEREYYYNDAGRQMRLLAESVRARYRELLGDKSAFPEEGYQGEYIRDIAQALLDDRGDRLVGVDAELDPFADAAQNAIFGAIRRTLERLGVTMDRYYNEGSLYRAGAIEKTLEKFKARNLSYESEGAVWLKASALGRAEDRVLVKSSGEPTYRLPDIAYHADKLDRGFDLLVDVFGADHRDTYPDVLAGLQGLGYAVDGIQLLIHQFVTLTEKGRQVKMSTRKATYITLDELMEEVGRDVVRYFFLMRTMDSHLKFDLDLARTASDVNPVYYLQYAHARMVNIEKHAAALHHTLAPDSAPLERLTLPEERTLIVQLWWFPEIVRRAGVSLEPQTVANYLQELATAYHRYYTVARVVTDDKAMTAARLVLTAACRQTLANGLAILGITAPERI